MSEFLLNPSLINFFFISCFYFSKKDDITEWDLVFVDFIFYVMNYAFADFRLFF